MGEVKSRKLIDKRQRKSEMFIVLWGKIAIQLINNSKCKRCVSMRFYLDHNIYIYSLNNALIGQAVEILKSDSVQFLYSPAHIEEVYTEFVKNESRYQQNMQRIFEQISKFTNYMEYLPSDTQIIIKSKQLSDCYNRVAVIDTTQRMEFDGKY